MLKKIAIFFLCLLILMQSFPVTTFADLNLEGYKTQEELRQAIAGDAKWIKNFPNGLFNFVGTQFQINENQKSFEIAVVRQGGTQGKASVDFKAIDVTAEYGKDYVIRVYENSAKNEMEKNPQAFPLINTVGDSASINISQSVYGETKSASGEILTEVTQSAVGRETVVENVYSYSELSPSTLTIGGGDGKGVGSLRGAKEAYLGKKSDRPDWQSIDKKKVEELKSEYDKFLYKVEGAQTTIEFEDGEYIKYLYFIPLNDNISESEEQVMFALANPTGGACRGEFYMSYMNIIDDEKPEKPVFEIDTPIVTAKEGTASVAVRRKGGLQQYSSVIIGTEEETAISGMDYEPGKEELFFTPGTEVQTVTVNVLENSVRKTERRFTIALDRTSENVNPDAAGAIVIIPGTSDGTETVSAMKINALGLAYMAPQNINAERISEHGCAPEKGQWVITGEDLQQNSMYNQVADLNIATSTPGDGLKLEYTTDAMYDWNNQYEMYHPVSGLGGVDKIGFSYYNNGKGDGAAYNYNFKFYLYTKGYMSGTKDIDPKNIKSFDGRFDKPCSYETPVFDINAWRDIKGFYFTSYANANNHTAPYISKMTLKLKEFSTKILSPGEKIQLKNYTIDKGKQSAKVYSEFDAGYLYVKKVYSNVGNYQDSPENPKVYRSDRIEFGYEYSKENPNGKYATFDGFEIKSGDNWVSFKGADLVLDANFFRKSGILDAVKDGTIEIRPVFRQNGSGIMIYCDASNGKITNLEGADWYSQYTYYFVNTPTYVGDKITGLEAVPFDVTRPAVWTAKSGDERPSTYSMRDNSVKIKMENINGKLTAGYMLENESNKLYVNFGERLIVRAQPDLYKHYVYMYPYKLDGKQYNDRTEFINEMENVYASEDKNPTMNMQFDYVMNDDFPDAQLEKEKFGSPQTAYLNVHKKDGTVKSYTINFSYLSEKYNIRTFKFSCKPKDEGWDLDDYATITIEGSNIDNNPEAKTQEMVVDFLANSADGVIVSKPNDKDSSQIWTGNINQTVEIDPADPLGNYIMQAVTSPGYMAQWSDFSPDYDNNGVIEPNEHDELESILIAKYNNKDLKLDNILDPNVYWGNNFAYQPGHFNPSKVYYNFIKQPTEQTNLRVIVPLCEQFSTVLNPNVLSNELPIKDAEVYIGNKRIFDKNDGIYSDQDTYIYGANYLGQAFYKGEVFNFRAIPSKTMKHVLYTSNLMRAYDFKAKIREDSEETDQKLDADNTNLSIKDAVTTFSYRIDGSEAGIVPNDSIIRFYDSKGSLISWVRTGAPKRGEFSYPMNTYAEGIKRGYSMTISGVLAAEDGTILHEFPENHVGLTFAPPLTTFSALTSFKTPLQPVVSLMGKLNNKYDLGMDVDLEKSLSPVSTYTDSNSMKRKIRTLSFGFNDEYEKKFEKNAKDEKSDDEDKEDDTQKGNDKVLEEEAGSKNTKDSLKELVDDTTPDEGQPNQPASKSTGGGDFHMTYKISLALTLEVGQKRDEITGIISNDSYHYLSSLVIMSTLTADYKYERTYMTPIGVPVTATVTAGGGASAVLAFDANHKDPYNEKYRLDGEGTFELKPANYNIYSKFIIKPSITLGVAAGFDYLNLGIDGTVDFNLAFDVPITGDSGSASGSGYMEISAHMKIKILFVQKKWTIYKSSKIDFYNSGSSLQKEMASALSNPYQNYLYEKADTIEDEDILPRSYMNAKGDWNGGSGLQSVQPGIERVLQTGVFPYPQTKLIQIDKDRTLLLFIEDDGSRDERNRASLMYSIMEGGNSTVPAAVYNDGTWDEDPDAFVVGDRILVTWSDAGRKFTGEDTQTDILSAMNISGVWLDPNTESFGDKFPITKTVDGGDRYADLNPKISYHPGTKRLMVYYTKTDYNDRWETGQNISSGDIPYDEAPEALYGDIVNGYSVIAYRYADFDEAAGEFVWNETYNNGENLSSEHFYGQRFLSLAPAADIVEEERELEDETVTVGEGENSYTVMLTHRGTSQTVKSYSGMKDPRIIGMDMKTHNGMAVFAYVIDSDSDLCTQHDYRLYIQTYDYSKHEFSKPIEITNDNVLDAQPRFVELKDTIYLYWLNNYNLVYTNVTQLLRGLIENKGILKEASVPESGETFYIIDKTHRQKDAHINTAIDEEDPIEDYDIVSNGSSIYALWTEERISYKNGLRPGDTGTEDPANINKEKQIFAACSVSHEPTEDAGILPWTRPVQVTFEPGANYSDLSFTVPGDDQFLVSYAKYARQYNPAAGYHSDTGSVRDLAVNQFSITSEAQLGEITVDTEYPTSGQAVEVSATLGNNGLKALEDVYFQFYTNINGSQYAESQWYPKEDAGYYILGGTSTVIKDSFIMPDTLDGIEELKVGFRVKNSAGKLLASKEKELTVKPELKIHVLECELTGEDTAFATLYVKNAGNRSFDDTLTITAGDKTLHTQKVTLGAGDVMRMPIEILLDGAEFSGLYTAQDGGRFDTLTLNFKFGEFKAEADLKREVSADAYNELQNVESLNISRKGTLLRNGSEINIGRDDVDILEAEMVKKAASTADGTSSEQLRIVWTSDNPSVVAALPKGLLVPLADGTATITAEVQPVCETEASYGSGYFEVLDKSYMLPDMDSKKMSFIVNVGAKPGGNSGTHGSKPVEDSVSVGQNPNAAITLEVKAPVDAFGKASASVTAAHISEAVRKALDGMSKQGQTDTASIELKVEASADVKSVEMGVPAAALKEIADNGIQELNISSPVASIMFDGKALTAIAAQATEDIKITASKADISVLSEDIRKTVGEHPVFDFSVTSGNSTISQFNGNVKVSVPYTPGQNEDINAIVIYYINDDGKLEIVSNCTYNPETGMVTFKTSHFSKYAVGYNKVTFRDVPEDAWYAYAVGFIAARGITAGSGEGNYSPDNKLTRGQFLTMIMRTYGIAPDQNPVDNFSDAGNTYYTGYLAAAKRLGISNGTGNNMFTPDNEITRQEMFTLLYNTLKAIDKLPKDVGEKELADFSDGDQIAPWAMNAMTLFVKTRIISGTDGKLSAASTTTRAEMAQVLYNLLIK